MEKEIDYFGKQHCSNCGALTERVSHYELDENIYEFYLCDNCNNSEIGNLLKAMVSLVNKRNTDK